MASSTKKVAVIVGVGPGTGAAVARRFAKEGYAVGLLSRSLETLKPVEDSISSAGGKAVSVPCDVAKPEAVQSAFKRLTEDLGSHVEVLVYNSGPGSAFSSWPPPGILDLDPATWQAGLDVGVSGALWCCQQVIPGMVKAGKGTIIFTGATASLRGGKGFVLLSAPKFALRSLGQSIAREFQPQGVHLVSVTVDGVIATPRTARYGKAAEEMISPDAIADTYWHLHTQDRSCWTQELDIRPHVEKF